MLTSFPASRLQTMACTGLPLLFVSPDFLSALNHFFGRRSHSKMIEILIHPHFNSGHTWTVIRLSSSCFRSLWRLSLRTHSLWRIPSLRFAFHVNFTDSLNPVTADKYWHPPPSSDGTLWLRYTSLVLINISLLTKCRFYYFSFLSLCNHFIRATGNTLVIFVYPNEHASRGIREINQYIFPFLLVFSSKDRFTIDSSSAGLLWQHKDPASKSTKTSFAPCRNFFKECVQGILTFPAYPSWSPFNCLLQSSDHFVSEVPSLVS